MGAFIAFIGQIVLSEPIAIPSSTIDLQVHENEKETEDETEGKEKQE